MRFVCDSCRAQYMISDEKVGAKGVKVRCKKCGYVILVRRQDTSAPSPPQLMESPAPNEPTEVVKNKDALFKGVEDDEIGAVFDQVLSNASSAPKAMPQLDAQLPSSQDDNEEHDTTRVMDLATMRALAEQSGDTPVPAGASASAFVAPQSIPSHEWFVAIDEKQVGPLTLEKVKEHWDRGELSPDSLCWRAGFSDWMPLSDIGELASALAHKPPKPVISAPVATSSPSMPVESAFAAGASSKLSRSDIPVLGSEPPTEMENAWKPSAASALASLVQDEMAALGTKPAPRSNGTPAPPEGLIASSLLQAPPAPRDPVPNMPSATEHLAQPAPSNGGYVSMPYMPSYPVPPAPVQRGRGALIGVLSGVGVLVVLLLGAAVVLLYQQGMRRTDSSSPGIVSPPGPAITVVPPPTTNNTPGTTGSSTSTPATGTGGTGQNPSTVVATTNPPPGPSALEQGHDRTNITVPTPSHDRTHRSRRGENTPGASHRGEPGAPPSPAVDEPSSSDQDFMNTFGPGGAVTKPPPPKNSHSNVYVPPPPGGGDTSVKDRLEQSDIMEVVLSHKPAIRKCVDEQKAREPSSGGKLVVRWSVVPSGKVTGVAVQSEGMKSSPLAGCITGLVKSWTFPKHKTQGEPIDFPFTF